MSDGVISIVNSDEAALRIIVRQQRKEIEELKAAKGLVVAMIQTDANGKVEGIRHNEGDTFLFRFMLHRNRRYVLPNARHWNTSAPPLCRTAAARATTHCMPCGDCSRG